ncbi:MAG TPA: hypothetical protein DEV81_06070 [Cyanobacteria bacterium UBA11049]|nr:hypothetical protein [Cyanobacteria bacterium UBA11049]
MRWSSLRCIFKNFHRIVHNAAQILKNEAGIDGRIEQLCFQALLKAMSTCQTWAGPLQSGIVHFIKVIVTGQGYFTATLC